MNYQEIDIKPWTRLLGFGGQAALVEVPLDLEHQSAAGLAEEMAASQFLSTAEQQQLQSYSFPKRRLQWLGGRLAAKLAAGKLPGAGERGQPSFPWHHLQVGAENSGRPYLQWAAKAPDTSTVLPDISISHSGPVACALAVEQPARCGVDIQMITESILRVRERFTASAELALLEDLAGIESFVARLALLWAAKEAMRKAAGSEPLPGFLDMVLSNASRGSDDSRRPGFVFVFRCPSGRRAAAIHQAWGRESVEVVAMYRAEVALAFTILA